MGKNSDRESLIKVMANAIVHRIVAEHTNRPESKHFLDSEATEYTNQSKKIADEHHWANADKEYIKEKALKRIKGRMDLIYPDVHFSEKEAVFFLDKIISELNQQL